MTGAQVDADDRLLGLVIEKTDNRCKPARKYRAVECEAVGQATLERMLRGALDTLLPDPLEEVLEREAEQRRAIIELLDEMPR